MKKILVLTIFCVMIGVMNSETSAQESVLSTYGYFDAVLGKNRYESETWGFDTYHFTTITTYTIEAYRVYGDVTYEHGTHHTESNLGDLKVRAMLTWTYSDLLHVNVGKFLTPFGEYNLYHDATPVYTSVMSPRSLYWKRKIGKDEKGKAVKEHFFAKEAAGIWVWGNLDVVKWRTEYNLYLTNGRGAGNIYKVDDNEDKGIGGRITFESLFGLKIGGSFYTDKHGKLADDARVQVYTGQVELTVDELFVGGEVMYAKVNDNLTAWAWYGQLQYSIAEKYTPFVRIEHFDDSKELNPKEDIVYFGVNLLLNLRTFFKAEYVLYGHEQDDVFQSQIAIAF